MRAILLLLELDRRAQLQARVDSLEETARGLVLLCELMWPPACEYLTSFEVSGTCGTYVLAIW